jgi:hypothetical protein
MTEQQLGREKINNGQSDIFRYIQTPAGPSLRCQIVSLCFLLLFVSVKLVAPLSSLTKKHTSKFNPSAQKSHDI